MTSRDTVAVLLCATLALACTSITVQPVDASAGLQHVCIKENPKVLVSDFVPVVRSGLSRHGISSKVYSNPLPEECEFIMTYTALRTWDFVMILHHAELWLEHRGQIIASAKYHLRGEGGLSLMVWQSTETKMNPVIDKFLAAYRKVH